jgi:hypothetical protein
VTRDKASKVSRLASARFHLFWGFLADRNGKPTQKLDVQIPSL